MKKLQVKRLKRKCMVRGCTNLDTYSINRTGENGNTVIICKDCLYEALAASEGICEPPEKEYSIPPLFFGGDDLKQETRKSEESGNTKSKSEDIVSNEENKLTPITQNAVVQDNISPAKLTAVTEDNLSAEQSGPASKSKGKSKKVVKKGV